MVIFIILYLLTIIINTLTWSDILFYISIFILFMMILPIILSNFIHLIKKYTKSKWIKACGKGEIKIEWINQVMTLKVGDKCQKQFDISDINFVQYSFLWNKNYIGIYLHEEEDIDNLNNSNWNQYSHSLKYQCDDIIHFVERLKALDVKFEKLPKNEILSDRIKNKKSRIVVIKYPFISC